MFIQATLLGSQEHKTNLQIILSASTLNLHCLAAVFSSLFINQLGQVKSKNDILIVKKEMCYFDHKYLNTESGALCCLSRASGSIFTYKCTV